MTLHADALDVLSAWRGATREQERLRASYVGHLLARPDGVWRSCFPDHLTAGALVLSPDGHQVLLNLHRKAGRWFHFGGHLEPEDATLAGVALREATEESGLTGLRVQPQPLHLSRHRVEFCDVRGPVDHLDVRFLAVLGEDREPRVSEESLAVRWWPVDDLPTREPDMLELIALGTRRLAARDPVTPCPRPPAHDPLPTTPGLPPPADAPPALSRASCHPARDP